MLISYGITPELCLSTALRVSLISEIVADTLLYHLLRTLGSRVGIYPVAHIIHDITHSQCPHNASTVDCEHKRGHRYRIDGILAGAVRSFTSNFTDQRSHIFRAKSSGELLTDG